MWGPETIAKLANITSRTMANMIPGGPYSIVDWMRNKFGFNEIVQRIDFRENLQGLTGKHGPQLVDTGIHVYIPQIVSSYD